ILVLENCKIGETEIKARMAEFYKIMADTIETIDSTKIAIFPDYQIIEAALETSNTGSDQ
ncbi:hypothetical protein HK103_003403, partial [Boothiomyces macroporosus]